VEVFPWQSEAMGNLAEVLVDFSASRV